MNDRFIIGKVKLILVVVMTAFLTQTASALMWEDRDPNSGGGPLKFIKESYKGYSKRDYNGIFHIGYYGFDPSKHVVNSMKVWFAFADDKATPKGGGSFESGISNDQFEHVNIVVGGATIWSGLEVDGHHPLATYEWHSTTLTGTAFNAALADLLDDGEVKFKVSIDPKYANSTKYKDREDTWLKVAHMKVWGDYKGVPDNGSTMAMVGLSLLGLAACRRRLFK